MNQRGQVAIFAVLIFQVLFVFFAMVVNVGLLVHHKINLQNSVDLAAYYAAMKQAENLNALAHINYQIRQSWKLLTFRYRGLGMPGNTRADAPYLCLDTQCRKAANANEDIEYRCPASFCASYSAWNFMGPTENYCKEACGEFRVNRPGRPFAVIRGLTLATLPPVYNTITRLSDIARSTTERTCRDKTFLNWITIMRFFYAFKNDVANRRRVFNQIANDMSYSTEDFLDLDGESVRTGALKTFYKNLTYQNQDSIDPNTGQGTNGRFALYNSMAAQGCGGQRDQEFTPPAWAVEIFIKPLLVYTDADCDRPPVNGDYISFIPKYLNVGANEARPNYLKNEYLPLYEFLIDRAIDPETFSSPEARLWHSIAGYEKNPWCMSYVGVEAETTPSIPFSPFQGVKIKATAFAKPFGGRIGPWYYKSWPSSSMESQGSRREDQVDQALPTRVRPNERVDLTDTNESHFQRIDYGRYVGDRIGTKSVLSMAHLHEALWAHYPFGDTTNRINWAYWNHLLGEASELNDVNKTGDILAWSPEGRNEAPKMRRLEVGAVAPDNFDIAYYSIEPYFWRTYQQRLQRRFGSRIHVRGDLGYRRDAPEPWNRFSVIDQVKVLHEESRLNVTDALTYYIGRENSTPAARFAEVLTSFHVRAPGNFTLDPDRFGRCASVVDADPSRPEFSTAGHCHQGGRFGYSVKLVDPRFLSSSQTIGGEGQTGRIRNPPPGY